MFYAETEQRERISAVEYLGVVQKKSKLFCPGCKEPVFFKNGRQKLAHFSHYSFAECRQFSEGETALHLLGKQQLYHWLKRQGLQVEMEAWLPELKQRPDLLVTAQDGRKIALEYQCSPISFEELKNRTDGYQKSGYEVMWLCGKDYQVGKAVTSKQSQFFQYENGTGYNLISFDSEKNVLYFDHQFYYDHRNVVQYSRSRFHMTGLSFEKLETLYQGDIRHKTFVSNQTYPNRKRMALLHRKDATHRYFLERVYLAKQNLQTLPEWLFSLPTKTLFYQLPNYIWKFDFLCWLQDLGRGSVFGKADIEEYFSQVKVQPTLFIESELLMQPLMAFVAELVGRGHLQLIGPELWLTLKFF